MYLWVVPMANATISDVMDRAMNSESFLMQFRSDPEAALDEFDLAEEDERALLEQDDDALIDRLDENIKAATIYLVVPAKS